MPSENNTKKTTNINKKVITQPINKTSNTIKSTGVSTTNKISSTNKQTTVQATNVNRQTITKLANANTTPTLNKLNSIDGVSTTRKTNNIKPRSQRDKDHQRNLEENSSKRNTSKKGNTIIGILFIVLVLFVIVGFIGISFLKSDGTSKYFYKEDSVGAQNLYDNIMRISEENYPKTPEGVVNKYTEVYKLLYGNKIKDLSIVPNILDKQRILLSDDLLDSNSFEEQVNEVLYSIENLKNNKVKITSIEVKSFSYDQIDNTLAYVKVDKTDSLFQKYYYIYHLKLENEKWKITGWYNTDENYNIIEQK